MPRILHICGSLNQTSQMHQISQHLPEAEHFFTPFYGDTLLRWLSRNGFLEFTILGNKLRNRALRYLRSHELRIDEYGMQGDYDLVLTCTDLIVPSNVRRYPIVLVQEGMTDPEGFAYHLVRHLRLPRYLASTSTTGLSDMYEKFCVASEGYRDLFLRKGVRPEKLEVTGIPNFDNCARFHDNDFPHRNFVLVATSDTRETFRFENRRKLIRRSRDLADGRQLIFKLHPNENHARAIEEIREEAPEALVFTDGNIEHMIANCDVLITRFSTVVYIGLALGKEVYSDFDMEELRRQTPIQNGGTSAQKIADVCRGVLADASLSRPADRWLAAPLREGGLRPLRHVARLFSTMRS